MNYTVRGIDNPPYCDKKYVIRLGGGVKDKHGYYEWNQTIWATFKVAKDLRVGMKVRLVIEEV